MVSWYNPFSWFRRGTGVSDGFDPRNSEYPVSAVLPDNAKLISREWECDLFLNQGSEGACVGFSLAHEAAAHPVPIRNLTYNDAMMVYKEAQRIDEWPGEAYSGTSLNAGLKIAKRLKWIESYRWAGNVYELALAVGHLGPAVLATAWYQGMAHPRGGVAYVSGKQTGRHAYLCTEYDEERKTFTLHNSWGKHWGWKGTAKISVNDMSSLLNEGGLAAIPLVRGWGT